MMSQAELYQWIKLVGDIFGSLGRWQAIGLAVYSYGVVLARQCAPSKVAEKLVLVGKASSVQRRLERWIANERINWSACCRAWSAFVLRHYVGDRIILLVDETKLGKHLSVMVVGLAYRGCCIPLAFWCYQPDEWPLGQVTLIEELLCWVVEGVPDGVQPLLQADRGIGTSPDLIRVVEALGWQYLFRVQGQTRFQFADGQSVALKDVVTKSGQWTGTGKLFKKAGWLPAIGHVIWDVPYVQAWCLVTNCPDIPARLYARRYWQEASFRDLKSDGWQWQASHIFTPHHANLLVLVLSLAYAFVLSLGTLAFEEPVLAAVLLDKTCSVFRNGLRLWDAVLGQVHAAFSAFTQPFFVFLDPPSLKSVGP
jgi:hypothetical protein